MSIQTYNRQLEAINKANAAMLNSFPNVLTRDHAYALMVSIFGGEEEVNALPTLELPAIYRDYIDSSMINPEMVTAPVMKFTDGIGRRGFVVRAYINDDPAPGIQTFFERFKGEEEVNWADAQVTSGIIQSSGYIIENGIVRQDKLASLRELVNNKEANMTKIMTEGPVTYKAKLA